MSLDVLVSQYSSEFEGRINKTHWVTNEEEKKSRLTWCPEEPVME